MKTNNDTELTRIADLSARLLSLILNQAQSDSDPAVVAEAARLHDREGLYPKLTVTMPHGGGSVRMALVLCDPKTDEPLVSLFTGEAQAIGPGWAH